MDSDRREPAAPPTLRVVGSDGAWEFDRPFHVGREAVCDVCFDGHPRVSRTHLRVFPDGGTWWVEDLGSANGLLVGGARVGRAEVVGDVDVQVGEGGPHLTLSAVGAAVGVAARVAVGTAVGVAAGGLPEEPVAADDNPLRFAPEPSDVERLAANAFPAAPSLPDAPGTDASEEPTASETAAAPETTDASVEARGGDAPHPPADGVPLSYEHVVKHYFTDDADDPDAGERTRFIRQAYVDIQQATEKEHQSRQSRYRVLLSATLVLCVVAVGYAGYREYTVRQLRGQAQQLFYQLQTYNVAVAQQVVAVEQQIEAHPESADSLRVTLDLALDARRQTAARYDQFVRGLGVYDGLSSEEEAIYRVARAFGESELTIPPAFVDEVKVYVARWRNSNRFQTAVRTAQVNGYIPVTVAALRRNGLPPEFFYLALQESNYDTRIVGPWTRYGHAKGAWQFIPETGRRYGLETGPLVAQGVYDPLDERHDFDAAADAAARYLHDIYVHLSQASGLLVCASYNWGEHRVKQNMRGIANDPEHRTYWRFLTEYRNRMPDETKGYVMNIFAAAVIGQNPRMFGIDMDPPLSAAALAGSGGVRDDRDPSRPPTRLGTSALERRQTP